MGCGGCRVCVSRDRASSVVVGQLQEAREAATHFCTQLATLFRQQFGDQTFRNMLTMCTMSSMVSRAQATRRHARFNGLMSIRQRHPVCVS
jgi:hypothetical protein